MGIIGGKLGYLLLSLVAPRISSHDKSVDYKHDAQLCQFFGENFFELIKDKSVVDFGCGNGIQSVEMALRGAKKVIGLDIQDKRLEYGSNLAKQNKVEDRCKFLKHTDELVDIVISKDAFEHFSDPASILAMMCKLLKPNGCILASFGPTWLHPYGGHLFSVFPWAHLLFTEDALIKWRKNFKSDGAMKFSEVEGGLNQLTIRRFEQIVSDCPQCRIEWLEPVPIRGFKFLKNRIFREFGTSIVRSKIVLSKS